VKFTVVAIGKLREAWVEQGCLEYATRLRKRVALEIVEVRDGEALLRKIPARHKVWALDERGRQFSSEELAATLEKAMNASEPGISFLIGGADGLPRSVVDKANVVWSLGRLTLPHRLARLIVLEQLYRAVGILRGEPYHRA
jgi:23S rRNA (pseudouridine1915-N3)-methyltransferase